MGPILKQGDLVKYHIQDTQLDKLGFKLGQVYSVNVSKRSPMTTVGAGYGSVPIIEESGELTGYADHFAVFKPVVDLPRGLQ